MDNFYILPSLYKIRVDHDFYGAYHPLNQNFFYFDSITNELIDSFDDININQLSLKDKKRIDELKTNDILLSHKIDYKSKLKEIGDLFSKQEPTLKLAYIIISENCNLNCGYCFVNGSTPDNYIKNEMSIDVSNSISEFIIKNVYIDNQSPFSLTFYGGEPLLNIPVFKNITENLRSAEQKGFFGSQGIKVTLVTNGTLITNEIAKYLIEKDISVSVSIDGTEKVHNTARKYNNNIGSFKSAIRGYKLLKEHGGKPSISCTIGIHNINHLEEISDYFIQMKPNAIGFNLMRNWLFGINSLNISVTEATLKLLKAFEILRTAGIYEDRIMRRLQYIMNGKIRPYDCSGCGDQLVFLSNGDYGPCHAFYPTRKYFFGNILNSTSFKESNVLKQWRNRTPFKIDKCLDCSFISICGAGCAYEAEIESGSFENIDSTSCEHCRVLIEWCIRDLYKTIDKNKELGKIYKTV